MIQVHKTKKEMGFKVSGEHYQQITQWAYAIDARVFKEQLAASQSDTDIGLHPDTLALMRYVEKQGGILPYYGVGGSRGVCTYRFRVITSQIELTVEHGPTHKVMSLDTPLETSEGFAGEAGRRFKYSPFPYLSKEKLPEAWSGAPPEALVCKIAGREYETLVT